MRLLDVSEGLPGSGIGDSRFDLQTHELFTWLVQKHVWKAQRPAWFDLRNIYLPCVGEHVFI